MRRRPITSNTPIGLDEIVALSQIPQDAVEQFFTEEFGSYEDYVRLCEDPEALGRRLWELEQAVNEICANEAE